MKKLLILVAVTVIAVSLIAGCAGEVKTYTDSGQAISMGLTGNLPSLSVLILPPAMTGR
jgi:hypothetical protein